MTSTELFDIATKFNGRREMNDVLFYQLANAAKARRESMRPWMVLRRTDSSKTFGPGDMAPKALPTDFRRPYVPYKKLGAVTLVGANGSVQDLTPISKDEAARYANTPGHYYFDYEAGTFAVTGALDQAYTAYLSFIKKTPSIDVNTTEVWPGFEDYSIIIAYDVIKTNKGQIDWDTTNQAQIPFTREDAAQIDSAMAMWDAALQQSAINI